jgi:hypothetical protein
MRPGGQLLEALLGELEPGVDGGSPAAEESGHVLGGFPFVDQFDGLEAASLQFLGGPDGSHTASKKYLRSLAP